MTHATTEVSFGPALGTKAFFLDLTDRAVKTFVQNVTLFLLAGTVLSVSWTQVLGSAGLATLVTVLVAVSTAAALTSGNPLVDILDRAARTFAGTLVGAIPVAGGWADIDWKNALALAGTTALVSVLTSLGTLNLGATKGLPSTAPVIPVAVPVIDPTGSVSHVDGD
ncbi:holin [Rhodococcoides corynebacterioides]|uniref:holin n=1 Tax=Rhodococcoides corynebacterioides TaxID=53972 RepID=UPI003F81F908